MSESSRLTDITKLRRMIEPDAPLQEQLKALRDLVGIPDRHLALAAGISTTTLRRWRSKGTDDPAEGIENLRVVVEQIAATEQKAPAAIGAWLRSRNRALGFERPLDLLKEADTETIGWIVEAGIAFARAYSLPESSPQGTPVPHDSSDLGGRLMKPTGSQALQPTSAD